MALCAKATNGVPTEIALDGNILPLYTFDNVSIDRKKARVYATTLRDKIGGFASQIPPLPMSGPIEGCVMWLLQTQCAVCSYAGFVLTPQSFGAPPGYGKEHHWGQAAVACSKPDYAGLDTPYGTDMDINVKQAAPRRPLAIAPGM